MGAMSSHITSLTIVYSTVNPGADQRKHESSASLAFVRGIHRVQGEFPAQMASNVENFSIWWRHHDSVEMISWPWYISYESNEEFSVHFKVVKIRI